MILNIWFWTLYSRKEFFFVSQKNWRSLWMLTFCGFNYTILDGIITWMLFCFYIEMECTLKKVEF